MTVEGLYDVTYVCEATNRIYSFQTCVDRTSPVLSLEELDKKLFEEIDEFKEERSLEELADILEVILAQCKAYGYDTFDLYKVNAEKRQARGSFNDKIFWSVNEE
jgi:predicted house-cleaning noncanonical NTP pyrophosphatase (MazG superfamily)